VRFCAASCMLGAIAITAALASLAASLYGQGKLSVDDAWQWVPPVLVPAAVTVVYFPFSLTLFGVLCLDVHFWDHALRLQVKHGAATVHSLPRTAKLYAHGRVRKAGSWARRC